MYQPIWCLLTFHHLHWTANSNTVEKSIMTIFFSLLNKWLLCPPSTPPSIWGCWMMGYIHKYTKGLYWLLNKQAPTYHSNYFQTIEYDRLSCNQIIMGRRTTTSKNVLLYFVHTYFFWRSKLSNFWVAVRQTYFCQSSRMSHFDELPDVVLNKIIVKKIKKISTVLVVVLCVHCKKSEKNLAKKCTL